MYKVAESPQQRHYGTALGCFAFGAYLLLGAYQTFARVHWPGFLPPQLDAIALLFSVLPEPFATYAAGVVTGALGMGCVVVGVLSWGATNSEGTSDVSNA